ncbi:TonB-dependent Receptor Plug Domain [Flagellimonas flava]|uniref:TonB-dependent Receptor Plug Domain n=1 Tax=Flagellimonas flava TaxID=570519 RepID=A0A1M5LZX1_9FLAO|nr:TonB-dependent Receptor Plug Domain [Allomuricauda flava]
MTLGCSSLVGMEYHLSNKKPASESSIINEPRKERKKPSHVTILWDASFSLSSKKIEQEILLLDEYFEYLNDADVSLLILSNDVTFSQKYQIKKGDWSHLKLKIRDITYDGGIAYDIWNKIGKLSGTVLLFSDGINFPDKTNTEKELVLFTINSRKKYNRLFLKTLGEANGGSHIDLGHGIKQNKSPIMYLKSPERQDLTKFEDYSYKNPIHKEKSISGVVTDLSGPLEGVNVSVKGTDRITTTDKNGKYRIDGKPSESLIFSYPDRDSIEVLIDETTNEEDIFMSSNLNYLDEVVVEGETKSEAGIDSKQKIKTNFGVLDKKSSGFSVRTVTSDKIPPSSVDIYDVIQNALPGVRLAPTGSSDNKLVLIRGGHRNFSGLVGAAWDIDGNILKDTDNIPFISAHEIETVTVMPGSWAAARYGSIAVAGIVIVRTRRTSNNGQDNPSNNGNPNSGFLNRNVYQKDAIIGISKSGGTSKPVQKIIESKDASEAYKRYLEIRDLYRHFPHFFSDVFEVFEDKWHDRNTSLLILSNIEELFYDDSNALKIAAYKYEEAGQLERALQIYRRILRLRPLHSQSYRDLANINTKIGRKKRAWNLYNGYLNLFAEGANYDDGLDQIVKKEMERLMEHGKGFNSPAPNYSTNSLEGPIEIIAEWNQPEAEFELQFVHPNGLFYDWKHFLTPENDQRMLSEKKRGYSAQSFFIDSLSKERWLVNIRYKGNKSEFIPTFIKLTIRDTRQKGFTEEVVKVLKLKNQEINYKVASINSENFDFFE